MMKGRTTVTIAAFLLVSAFCLQAILAIPRLSATSDERVHLAAGYSYWKTRDFRMNPEHPPLVKLLAALPLLPMHPRFETASRSWITGAEDTFGEEFVYGNDADRLVFWSRVPMVLIAAIGAIVTFLWARDLFGNIAGLLALTLYAFCPDLLAHGMLVTTDVPLAAFTVLTLYLFWKRGENPAWTSDVLTGLALGAAMTSKFSGAILPIVIMGFCIARKQIRSLCWMAFASLTVIEVTYLFSASPLVYFRNMQYVNLNHPPTYPFYLFGAIQPGGWWYYFIVAFAVKATLPVVLLVVFAALGALRGFSERSAELILLATIVIYMVATTIGAAQIGVRYILPVFPLLYIWISRIVRDSMEVPWRVAILGVLVAWHVWSGISAFPNYIPYFNELAGGPAKGPAILDDSNIGWGQGVKQAAVYVREHHLPAQSTFFYDTLAGRGAAYYGIPGVLSNDDVMDRLISGVPAPGTYILSSQFVTRVCETYRHWRAYMPVDRIGESLWVYTF